MIFRNLGNFSGEIMWVIFSQRLSYSLGKTKCLQMDLSEAWDLLQNNMGVGVRQAGVEMQQDWSPADTG